ncbi:MAG TPA: gamma-glutamyltransferase [Sphingomicrobium sp.]|nr:gamma-glutamyltransferase [Sphingomicrobium sp.]
MVSRFAPLLASFALVACVAAANPPAPSRAAPPGMVSAADPRAAEAGAEMLRRGGNAADAALATMLALTVVEPQSSGIGGGGFLVYSTGGAAPVTYDGREIAPAAADGKWFWANGAPIPIDQAIPGGKSVGVPGNIRLMALAHGKHGKLPWKSLFEPAIRLARDGFAITKRLHFALARGDDEGLSVAALSAAGRALYFGADGQPRPVGTVIRNPALADFLEQLSERGPDSFYVGPNARAIVAEVNGSARNPSRMTAGDVASYDAKARPAVCGDYRGYRVCGMGPPSSGATTVFAILKQLERFDIANLGPRSGQAWHLIAESMRLAYADRDQFLGDPDFVSVPVAGLIDPGYLAQRSALIAPDRSIAEAGAGSPAGAPAMACAGPAVERGTSHFVAVDRWGNVASETSTIESAFGSGLVVNGYYLNNELTDFSFWPTKDGCPVANRVDGGKRPRSSMSPTIVYGPDGKVRLALGAAGGATIIAQVAKAIIGVVDWKLTAQDAIALPAIYAPGGKTIYLERGTWLESLAPELRALGHQVESRGPSFKANAIEFVGGRWVGAADPRSEGVAVGE